MFFETVDLYREFGLPRGERSGGKLTVYARAHNPENTPHTRPAVLVIPGGAYAYVSFREGEPVALRFLAEGYAAFVLEYSVPAAYPVPLIEAALAMRYIRENAKTYGIDPDHVCAAGFSAGGHLAGMLATLFDEKEVSDVAGGGHVRPDAVILGYSVLTTGVFTHGESAENISGGDAGLRGRLSLENRVTKESAPAFIWHTAEDDLVPVENCILMAMAYRAKRVPFELHIFGRGGHGLSTADIEVTNARGDKGDSAAVRMWIPLALNFLEQRGFVVK